MQYYLYAYRRISFHQCTREFQIFFLNTFLLLFFADVIPGIKLFENSDAIWVHVYDVNTIIQVLLLIIIFIYFISNIGINISSRNVWSRWSNIYCTYMVVIVENRMQRKVKYLYFNFWSLKLILSLILII